MSGVFLEEKREEKKELNSDAKSGAFHLFLYLTGFLSFGFVFFGLTNILFEFFNKTLAGDDPLATVFNQESVRMAIAFLIIAGPLYYFLINLINRKLFLKEIDVLSGVRKVLTYLALFVLVAIIIGDLIFLLSSFLNGDYTEIFLAKAFSLLILAGVFGCFYFWEVRRKIIEKKNFSLWLGGFLILWLGILFLGFSIIDKPSVAREKRLDAKIIMQMNSLRNEIKVFYSDKKRNPTQSELENRVAGEESIALKKGEIEYVPKDFDEYSLCGVFKHEWDGKEQSSDFWNDSFWKHPQGKYCFEIKENSEAEKDLNSEKELLK